MRGARRRTSFLLFGGHTLRVPWPLPFSLRRLLPPSRAALVAQARRRRRGYDGSDGSTDGAAEVECVGEVVLTPAPRRGMGAGSEPGREAVGAVAEDSGGAGGGWRRLPYPPRSRGFGRHPSFSREPPGHRCSTCSFIAFLQEVIPCVGADGHRSSTCSFIRLVR
jgi:hypothetical protein